MQSPRPSANSTMRSSFRFLLSPLLPALLLVAAAGTMSAQTDHPAPPPPAAPADSSSSSDVQTLHVAKPKDPFNRDVALIAFGQDTNRTNGNSIRNGTTASGGGMVAYRQSVRWWAGYEASYGYTKYTDTYFYNIYRVKHTSNEASLAYLLKSPAYRGFHFFGTLGAGIISFDPKQYGGSVAVISGAPATQTLPLFTDSIGVEKVLTGHFGVRIQYRDDIYKDPNFKQVTLNTTRLRSTNEPGFGVYYRF